MMVTMGTAEIKPTGAAGREGIYFRRVDMGRPVAPAPSG